MRSLYIRVCVCVNSAFSNYICIHAYIKRIMCEQSLYMHLYRHIYNKREYCVCVSTAIACSLHMYMHREYISSINIYLYIFMTPESIHGGRGARDRMKEKKCVCMCLKSSHSFSQVYRHI